MSHRGVLLKGAGFRLAEEAAGLPDHQAAAVAGAILARIGLKDPAACEHLSVFARELDGVTRDLLRYVLMGGE